MTTLTIEIPEKEEKFVLELLKKIGAKVKKSSYDANFVAKIKEGEIARVSGKKGVKIDVDNLWK